MTDDVSEEDELPGTLQQRSTSPPPIGTRSQQIRPKLITKSFMVQPISTLTESSSSNNKQSNDRARRRNPSKARPQGLSQSMLTTHRELIRRPRGPSAERRLGVRRALDLAGSTIIAYSGTLRGSVSSADSTTHLGENNEFDGIDPDDDEDEFKATVVLEQMMRAADVGALLQDWDNSIKWSTRLYKELNNGYLQHRGEDPAVGWHENQIKFFDFYILPLAKNLGVMGVFEESGLVGNTGGSGGGGGGSSFFVNCVKSNLARWIEEGARATELMMKEDEEERRRGQELRELRQQEVGEEEQCRIRQGLTATTTVEEQSDRIDSLTQPMESLNLHRGSGRSSGSSGSSGGERNIINAEQHNGQTTTPTGKSSSNSCSLSSSINSINFQGGEYRPRRKKSTKRL